MKVLEILDDDPAVSSPNESASVAWERLQKLGKRHVVVVQSGEVVGVVSAHDLSGPSGGAHRRMGRRVGDLMRRDVLTVTPATSVRAASARMRRAGVGCLPVLGSRGALVGIVTIDRLLALLEQKLKGANAK
jgi:CBS domain-containing protein